jgi:hypothetical protein
MKPWHAQSTVADMKEMLQSDFQFCGVCYINPLTYVGQSGGVHVFKTRSGDDEMIFNVTPDMDYTIEVKKQKGQRRLV